MITEAMYLEKKMKIVSEKPYLTRRVVEHRYNPNYGDDRICECGRTYRQHFKSVCGTISLTDGGMSMFSMSHPSMAELAPDTRGSCKRFREPKILITGKELKFAAEHKLKVRYVEQYHNPMDSHKNFNHITAMEPANTGYYIGNSDIDPQTYEDDEKVSGDFPEGTFAVYKVPGIAYGEYFKKNDVVVIKSTDAQFNGQLGLVRSFREDSRGVWVELFIDEDDRFRVVTIPASRCEVIDTFGNYILNP